VSVHVKAGVQFTRIAPAGFRILGALEQLARTIPLALTITSACDGVHSGPNDPHHRGEAYDVRSHDFDAVTKQQVVDRLRAELGPQFAVILEGPDTPNEHLHCQVRKFTVYS
jgi:hypothetical protein